MGKLNKALLAALKAMLLVRLQRERESKLSWRSVVLEDLVRTEPRHLVSSANNRGNMRDTDSGKSLM